MIEAAKLAYGMDMAAFLCWLGVRIMECHRVLRDDGSMFLHIDHTAHAWVKCMMDDIFGTDDKFRNEIVWGYTGPGSPNMRQFNRKHDTILWYCKGDRWTFNRDAARAPYKDGKPHTGGFTHKSGAKAGQNMDAATAASYTDGKILETWWTDIAVASRSKTENTKYKTQKPLKLLRRIIEVASYPGDMVLDPFCGCATTPIAAEQTGRQWIGMDLWDKAHDMVLERLQRHNLAVPDVEYKGQGDLIPFGHVRYTQAVPRRDDDMKVAVVDFELEPQAILEPWEKLRPAQMREILGKAQRGYDEFVVCAGCGRQLEDAFMELDHLQPKSLGGENVITNRILICRPCNGRKGNKETMAGLWDANKKSGWMHDETRAKINHENALKTSRTYKRRHRH